MDKIANFRNTVLLAFLVIQGTSALIRPERTTRGESCVEQGTNPHPYDCHKYMICTGTTLGGFLAHHYSCPESEAYSVTEKTCVPEEKIGSCLSPSPDDSDCDGKMVNCKDCSTLVFCQKVNEIYHVLSKVNCTGDLMYCEPGKIGCTDTIPPECYSHSECTGVGIFPNIKNCSIYQNCTAGTDGIMNMQTYVCPNKEVFNTSGNGQCQPREKPSDCVTLKCGDTLETKVYPGDPRYFVVCISSDKYFIYKCKEGEIFDEEQKQCVVNPGSSSSTSVKTS